MCLKIPKHVAIITNSRFSKKTSTVSLCPSCSNFLLIRPFTQIQRYLNHLLLKTSFGDLYIYIRCTWTPKYVIHEIEIPHEIFCVCEIMKFQEIRKKRFQIVIFELFYISKTSHHFFDFVTKIDHLNTTFGQNQVFMIDLNNINRLVKRVLFK